MFLKSKMRAAWHLSGFSEAFDIVPHGKLLVTLEKAGLEHGLKVGKELAKGEFTGGVSPFIIRD